MYVKCHKKMGREVVVTFEQRWNEVTASRFWGRTFQAKGAAGTEALPWGLRGLFGDRQGSWWWSAERTGERGDPAQKDLRFDSREMARTGAGKWTLNYCRRGASQAGSLVCGVSAVVPGFWNSAWYLVPPHSDVCFYRAGPQ